MTRSNDADEQHTAVAMVGRVQGERGRFVLTDAMLLALSPTEAARFEQLLLDEAHRRGLVITVTPDLLNRSQLIEWEPAEPYTERHSHE